MSDHSYFKNKAYFNKNYPIWLAPAKLNLFLHITRKRDDGYHNLQTIFQLLDYGDQLQFIPREDNKFSAKYNIAGINAADDLILKAARSLYQYALEQKLIVENKNNNGSKKAYGVDIYLSKKLPMGGGLGGGSSDAATTFKALNQLWNLNLDNKILSQIGLKLGADIPIFIFAKSCWAEGVGELLTAFSLPASYYVVVIPKVHISTAKLFADNDLQRNCKKIDRLDFEHNSVLTTDLKTILNQTINVFESIVRKNYPEIESAFECLSKYGAPRLTGTGACLFISIKTEAECVAIINQLSDNFSAFYAKGV